MIDSKKYEWFDKRAEKWNLIFNIIGIPYILLGGYLVMFTAYSFTLPVIKNIELSTDGFATGITLIIIFSILRNCLKIDDRINRLEAANSKIGQKEN